MLPESREQASSPAFGRSNEIPLFEDLPGGRTQTLSALDDLQRRTTTAPFDMSAIEELLKVNSVLPT